MPAITGIIGFGPQPEKLALLQQMVKCVIHESFYISGTYSNEELGLWVGWANLKGSYSDCMPLWNEKKDICLILTGEDFTDAAEIGQLKQRGHDFEIGDGSYLVHLYEELGDRFFGKLNGRFSGVLADFRQHKVILFNDRYGLNRIYYHEKDGMCFFSSEAKALLSIAPELRQINLDALAETYSYGCVLRNRTLYKGISLVPGGSVWTYRKGGTANKAVYFDPRQFESLEPLSHPEYYRNLKETWIRVLPRYLSAHEPIALSLTGGEDCRMILAWAKMPPGSLPCYTFGGSYRDCLDVKIGRHVAFVCHQPHHVIRVDDAFLNEFPYYATRTVYLTDGNMGIAGSPGLFVNKRVREIAPIRLTGNYGQEILRSSVAFRPTKPVLRILESDFARLVENATKLYHEELVGNRLSFIAFKQVPWHHYSRLASELSQVTLRSPYLDNEILSLAFRAPKDLATRDDIQLRMIAEGNPELSKIETDRGLLYRPIPAYSWAKQHYRDFTARAEYAFDTGMPNSLAKVDQLFKRLHLEHIFLGRNKYYHFRIWYRDRLAGYVKDTLLDPRAKNRPYLKKQSIEAMINSHIKGTANYTGQIHWLLTAELIHRQLIRS
jgi:asparagine synthase (glutamine-hydrolysing)